MITQEQLHVTTDELNDLARIIHKENKDRGWWDNPRSFMSAIVLVSSEIAEATEAERKNLMDDHLPERKGGEVELADALIRTLDLGDAFGFRVVPLGDSSYLNSIQTRLDTVINHVDTIAVAHLALHRSVTRLVSAVEIDHGIDKAYSCLVQSICLVSMLLGYDIFAAEAEKRKYNGERADHKRENRAKEGGKKW